MLLKIKTDIGCRVYLDGKQIGIAEASELLIISVNKGQYWGRFESFYDSNIVIEKVISVIDYDVLEVVSFLPIIDANKLILIPKKSEDGLFGYVELFSNKYIISPQYENARRFKGNFSVVFNGGYYGLIDKLNKSILPCSYDDLRILANGWIIVQKNEKYGLFHLEHAREIAFEWDAWSFLKKTELRDRSLETIKLKDHIKLRNNTGVAVFSCKNNEYVFFSDGDTNIERIREDGFLLLSSRGQNTYYGGLVSPSWRLLTPLKKYNSIGRMVNDRAIVSVRDGARELFGLIDNNGNTITDCKYLSFEDFHDGLALVSRFDKSLRFGYVNRSGEEVIPCVFICAQNFSGGYAYVVGADYTPFVIDQKGKMVFSLDNECLHSIKPGPFLNGLARFSSTGAADRHGFINTKGLICKDSIEYDYGSDDLDIVRDDKTPMIQGLRLVKRNGCIGFVDSNCDEVLPTVFQYVHRESGFKNRIVVKSYGKYGVLNTCGQEVISCLYDDIQAFDNEGLFAAMNNEKYALFNENGVQLTPFKYDKIGEFLRGKAFFEINDYIGIIDSSGREVLEANQYRTRADCYFHNGISSPVYQGEQPGLLISLNLSFIPSTKDYLEVYTWDYSILQVCAPGFGCCDPFRMCYYVDSLTGYQVLPNLSYNQDWFINVSRDNNGGIRVTGREDYFDAG